MNRYLTNQDYNILIQEGQLSYQLVQNNVLTLLQAERFAQEEAYSLLVERYDIDSEFTNTATWSYGITYSAASRIILDYATFSSTSTYSLGNCVIIPNQVNYDMSTYDTLGVCYCLTGATTWSGPTTSSPVNSNLWTNLGLQYQIYYTSYPVPYFNYLNYYLVGDKVFYANQIWSCVIPTPLPNQTYQEQFVSINNVPRNVIPTDITNRNNTWWIPQGTYSTPLTGMTYSIGTQSVGTYSVIDTLPTNTKFWTQGDNRSQLMVLHIMEASLYYLHKNIQPTNVPPMRIEGYKNATDYFTDLAFGRKNSPMLVKQPQSGLTINFGGNCKVTRRW
jgi:hypothetical protein